MEKHWIISALEVIAHSEGLCWLLSLSILCYTLLRGLGAVISAVCRDDAQSKR